METRRPVLRGKGGGTEHADPDTTTKGKVPAVVGSREARKLKEQSDAEAAKAAKRSAQEAVSRSSRLERRAAARAGAQESQGSEIQESQGSEMTRLMNSSPLPGELFPDAGRSLLTAAAPVDSRPSSPGDSSIDPMSDSHRWLWNSKQLGIERAPQDPAEVSAAEGGAGQCSVVVGECDVPSPRAPSIVENPYGPALCVTTEHQEEAMARLRAALNRMPTPVVVVDLEGELGARIGACVDLLQIGVESVEGDPPLTYVFDTHVNPWVLDGTSPNTIRTIFGDPRVIKVFHYCHGDVSTLMRVHGVRVEGVFDTAVADSVLLGKHHNSARGLSSVVESWHPRLDEVKFTHKHPRTTANCTILRRQTSRSSCTVQRIERSAPYPNRSRATGTLSFPNRSTPASSSCCGVLGAFQQNSPSVFLVCSQSRSTLQSRPRTHSAIPHQPTANNGVAVSRRKDSPTSSFASSARQTTPSGTRPNSAGCPTPAQRPKNVPLAHGPRRNAGHKGRTEAVGESTTVPSTAQQRPQHRE